MRSWRSPSPWRRPCCRSGACSGWWSRRLSRSAGPASDETSDRTGNGLGSAAILAAPFGYETGAARMAALPERLPGLAVGEHFGGAVTSQSAPVADRLVAALASMRGRRIVVVGDVVLDEYLIGRATRLSREAPVPILELVERSWRAGAGANPAANVAALRGEPVMIGVVGADPAGQRLQTELARAQVDTSGLVVTPDRSTAIKTRILATHAS